MEEEYIYLVLALVVIMGSWIHQTLSLDTYSLLLVENKFMDERDIHIMHKIKEKKKDFI